MTIDKRLLEILCCPASKQAVLLLSSRQIEALGAAQAIGSLKFIDGTQVISRISAGLVTADGKTVYLIDDGIPVMLIEQGIETSQLEQFTL